jgi:hypothetical protein
MQSSLDRRVSTLEKVWGEHEGTEILVFADGHSVELPKGTCKNLVAEICVRRSTLPICHDPV